MTTACVLVVEDNDDLRSLYRRALNNEGYDAVLACNGQEAITFLEDVGLKPSVILLDLMMPVMDGWQFLERRGQSPDMAQIPVVVCSAARESIPAGVRYLRKPVDLSELLDVVDHYCT